MTGHNWLPGIWKKSCRGQGMGLRGGAVSRVTLFSDGAGPPGPVVEAVEALLGPISG